MRGEFELFTAFVELIPVVGPFWADAFHVVFGVADAMNMQRFPKPPSRRTSHDRRLAFAY